jgi:uncharacterized damage-inducible protein DinB
MDKPASTEHIPYYERYISLVPEGDILKILEGQLDDVRAFVESVPEEKETYRYAPGKWSLRQVLSHVVDTERVFAYRACWIARGDTQPLVGYDQDLFETHAEADKRTLKDLQEELEYQRRSNVLLLRAMSDEASRRMGSADGAPVSVRALAYLMAGHLAHHLRGIREQYGVSFG